MNELTFNGFIYSNLDEFDPDAGLSADIGLLGVPSDMGSTRHAGQAEAPYCVRALEIVDSLYDPATGICYDNVVSCEDYGDTYVVPGNLNDTREQTSEFVVSASAACDLLVLIGGDHSITADALDGFVSAGERLPVIHVDAHSDNGYDFESDFNHASWARYAVDHDLTPSIDQYGVRAFGYRYDNDNLRTHGGSFQGQLAHALRVIHDSDTKVYVTVDLDVVDPAYAPGVAYPEPGGWTSEQLLMFVRLVAATGKVRAIDFVEVIPTLDQHDLTIRLLHRAVLAVVAGVGLHKYTSTSINERAGESARDSGSDSEGGSSVSDEETTVVTALPEGVDDVVVAEGSMANRASTTVAKPGRGAKKAARGGKKAAKKAARGGKAAKKATKKAAKKATKAAKKTVKKATAAKKVVKKAAKKATRKRA